MHIFLKSNAKRFLASADANRLVKEPENDVRTSLLEIGVDVMI